MHQETRCRRLTKVTGNDQPDWESGDGSWVVVVVGVLGRLDLRGAAERMGEWQCRQTEVTDL